MPISTHEALDVLIIGAGSVGSSVAMHLGQAYAAAGGSKKIRVIDPDLEGSYSSSERNAGGVRATLSDPLNISLSKLSLDYYARVRDEVGFREVGYLWLSEDSAREQVARSMRTQAALGWDVELWDLARIRKERPFLDKLEGVGFGWFGKRDGLINPNLLKLHYRGLATKSGVEFKDRTEIVRATPSSVGGGFDVVVRRKLDAWTEATRETYFGGESLADSTWVEETLHVRQIVNCAGAWGSEVARRLGYVSHVIPSRRQACLVETRGVDLTRYGMTISPAGVYFHPEASYMVAGINEPETKPGFNFEFDGQSYFEEKVWPELYGLSTSFEELKLKSGWAGLYENSPDHSAIIGAVETKPGLYECMGFSGHGVMQSYGAGLALGELMTTGKYATLDLGSLSSKRFASSDRKDWMKEGWVI